MQFSNQIGNVEGKGDKNAGVDHVTEQCKRRSVRDMADMFQQITDEKIQKFKQREIILGRKENQQSSKEESSGSVQTNELPSNNDQYLPPPLPSKLTPPLWQMLLYNSRFTVAPYKMVWFGLVQNKTTILYCF